MPAVEISEHNQNMLLISGDTRPLKETIKSFDGRWIKTLKGWTVKKEKKTELIAALEAENADITTSGTKRPAEQSDGEVKKKPKVVEETTNVNGVEVEGLVCAGGVPQAVHNSKGGCRCWAQWYTFESHDKEGKHGHSHSQGDVPRWITYEI